MNGNEFKNSTDLKNNQSQKIVNFFIITVKAIIFENRVK